jgi:hypothetical protein
MAKTTLAVVAAPGSYAALGAAISFVAGDVSNGNQFVPSGKDLVIVRNEHSYTAYNITFQSSNDPFGRKGNIVESVVAGTTKIFGPFSLLGWRQNDGYFYLDAEDNDLKIAVVSFP